MTRAAAVETNLGAAVTASFPLMAITFLRMGISDKIVQWTTSSKYVVTNLTTAITSRVTAALRAVTFLGHYISVRFRLVIWGMRYLVTSLTATMACTVFYAGVILMSREATKDVPFAGFISRSINSEPCRINPKSGWASDRCTSLIALCIL